VSFSTVVYIKYKGIEVPVMLACDPIMWGDSDSIRNKSNMIGLFLTDPQTEELVATRDDRMADLLSYLFEKESEIDAIIKVYSRDWEDWLNHPDLTGQHTLMDVINSKLAPDSLKDKARHYLSKSQEVIHRQKIESPIKHAPRAGYIYLIKAETGHCKIGRTKSIKNRMEFFGVKLPFKFDIIHTFPADDMYDAERDLHSIFAEKRTNGEWFHLTDEDVSRISGISQYREGFFQS